MEFNIEIDHQVKKNAAVRYKSWDNKNRSIIYVSGFFCSKCSADETDVFLPHMLEHELAEILCNQIRCEDGEGKIKVDGFDQMSLKWHKKEELHFCGDTTKVMWSG